MPRKDIQFFNVMWKYDYGGVEKKERSKRVSFSVEKNNTSDVCKCDNVESLTCNLHDGCSEIKHKYFKLISKYFANHLFFKERDIISHLNGNYDHIAYCLESAAENIERLKKRKKEMFKDELAECLSKQQDAAIPRVVMMDDYDPEWNKFLSKWDNSLYDYASAKKQQKHVKVSLIKGGARELDGSLLYNNIHKMERLIGLLENAQEIIFMDFIMV
jgi:hypothetical protein